MVTSVSLANRDFIVAALALFATAMTIMAQSWPT